MFCDVFPKLKNSRFMQHLNGFFRSGWFAALIAALMAVSELFALEIPVYYLYVLFGCLICFFCEDTLGIIPIVCCSYMTFSAQNNAGKFTDATAFSDPKVVVQFTFILCVGVAVLLGRLVTKLIQDPHRGFPRFAIGFLLLGLAYALGGVMGGYFETRSVIFGLTQLLALSGLYFFCRFSVDMEKTDASYFLLVMTCIGVGLCAEIVGMYFNEGAISAEGVVRTNLYTGWGIHNNVGCAMAMCMPAPFYFSVKRKNGWIYTIVGCFFMLAVVLSQSRGAMIFGAVVFLASGVFVLTQSKGMERIWNLTVFLAVLIALFVSMIVLRAQLNALFSSLIESGTDDYGRRTTWERCIEKFKESPIFGVGFYHTPGTVLTLGNMQTTDGAVFETFMPPRAHNTYIQLITSGGLVALGAYAFHRLETLIHFFRRPTAGKVVIALSISALLLTSVLDCHFFNLGPGILYGALLFFAECEKPAKPAGSRK